MASSRVVSPQLVMSVLAATFAAPCLAAGPATQPQAGIPGVFRCNLARTGSDGSSAPTGLKQAWQFKVEYAQFLSSPLAHEGRVYGTATIADVTRNFGTVLCLDGATGNEIWKVSAADGEDLKGIFSSPVLSGDGKSVLVGEGLEFDNQTRLLCLDAATGKVRWTKKVPNNHVMGSPAAFGDAVVVGAGAIERNDHAEIRHTGYLLAVRISDGAELWKFDVVDPESSPAVAPGVVYVGSGLPLEGNPGTGAAVYALRTETDAELKTKGLDRVIWKTATPCGAVGPVTVTDELVLVGCGKSWWGFAVMESQYGLGGAVVALDRKTGKVVWKVETPDTVGAAIAVGDGKAFCPVGGHGRYSMTRKPKGELLALDLKDGKKLWSCQVSGGSPVLAAPALAGKRVYAVAGDGTLAVIDAAYGRIIEKHQLNAGGEAGPDGMSVSSPTISGGRLYVGSETGGLKCFAGSAPGAGR